MPHFLSFHVIACRHYISDKEKMDRLFEKISFSNICLCDTIDVVLNTTYNGKEDDIIEL